MARVTVNFERCKGCGLCLEVCPREILLPSDTINAKGVRPIQPRKSDECSGCRLCVIMCPDVAISIYK